MVLGLACATWVVYYDLYHDLYTIIMKRETKEETDMVKSDA